MKLVIQRVSRAEVEVAGRQVAAIARGLLVLAGVEREDDEADAIRAATKVAGLRIFADDQGRMNLALGDTGFAVLAVSQFTLAGSIRTGRRPGFDGAMPAEPARILFDRFVETLAASGIPVSTGVFRADMQVALVNDGPVTFIYDTRVDPV